MGKKKSCCSQQKSEEEERDVVESPPLVFNESSNLPTIEEVGNSGLFLLSNLGKGVTGEVMHVDSGYHTVGMCSVDTAAETAALLNSIAPKKDSSEAA